MLITNWFRFIIPGRVREWYAFLLPFLLGIGYVFSYYLQVGFESALVTSGLFLVTISATAGFGYLLNDLTDLKEDALSGKPNTARRLGVIPTLLILALFLLLALIPWMFLPRSVPNLLFYGSEVFLLLIYSIPPLRLKRLPIPGIVNDALYNSTVPVFIIITTFIALSGRHPEGITIPMALTFLWAFLKGARNILLHQLNDRRNDRVAGANTFVLRYGPLFTLNLINRWLIPVESAFLAILVLFISRFAVGFYWVFLGFLVFATLKIRIWSISWMPRRQFRFLFLYRLNDFYEEWVPVALLIYLSASTPIFLILLALHLLLFPRVLIKLFRDIVGMNHDFIVYYRMNVMQVLWNQLIRYVAKPLAWFFNYLYWKILRPAYLYIIRTPSRTGAFFISMNRKWFHGNLTIYIKVFNGSLRRELVKLDSDGQKGARILEVRLPQAGSYTPEQVVEEAKGLIISALPRLNLVRFTGGDPFATDQWYPLWEHMIVRKRGCVIETFTYADRIEDRAKRIIEKGLFRFLIPLVSLDEEEYERMTGCPADLFRKNLDFLEAYSRRENIPLHLLVYPQVTDPAKLPAMVDYCSSKRAFIHFRTGHPENIHFFTQPAREKNLTGMKLPETLTLNEKGLIARINRNTYRRFYTFVANK
jgi:4-hydroxybenzoate polyprenyltransferase/pyruvate-formate lyase-activating enzyme